MIFRMEKFLPSYINRLSAIISSPQEFEAGFLSIINETECGLPYISQILLNLISETFSSSVISPCAKFYALYLVFEISKNKNFQFIHQLALREDILTYIALVALHKCDKFPSNQSQEHVFFSKDPSSQVAQISKNFVRLSLEATKYWNDIYGTNDSQSPLINFRILYNFVTKFSNMPSTFDFINKKYDLNQNLATWDYSKCSPQSLDDLDKSFEDSRIISLLSLQTSSHTKDVNNNKGTSKNAISRSNLGRENKSNTITPKLLMLNQSINTETFKRNSLKAMNQLLQKIDLHFIQREIGFYKTSEIVTKEHFESKSGLILEPYFCGYELIGSHFEKNQILEADNYFATPKASEKTYLNRNKNCEIPANYNFASLSSIYSSNLKNYHKVIPSKDYTSLQNFEDKKEKFNSKTLELNDAKNKKGDSIEEQSPKSVAENMNEPAKEDHQKEIAHLARNRKELKSITSSKYEKETERIKELFLCYSPKIFRSSNQIRSNQEDPTETKSNFYTLSPIKVKSSPEHILSIPESKLEKNFPQNSPNRPKPTNTKTFVETRENMSNPTSIEASPTYSYQDNPSPELLRERKRRTHALIEAFYSNFGEKLLDQ